MPTCKLTNWQDISFWCRFGKLQVFASVLGRKLLQSSSFSSSRARFGVLLRSTSPGETSGGRVIVTRMYGASASTICLTDTVERVAKASLGNHVHRNRRHDVTCQTRQGHTPLPTRLRDIPNRIILFTTWGRIRSSDLLSLGFLQLCSRVCESTAADSRVVRTWN